MRETGRHPHEVLLHLWAVLVGALNLTGLADRPRSVAEALPPWVQVAWFGLLLAGGLTGLVAAWLQGRPNGSFEYGLRLEAGALSFLAGGVLLYCSAIITAAGWTGVAASSLSGMYGVASLFRIAHIVRDLRPPSE